MLSPGRAIFFGFFCPFDVLLPSFRKFFVQKKIWGANKCVLFESSLEKSGFIGSPYRGLAQANRLIGKNVVCKGMNVNRRRSRGRLPLCVAFPSLGREGVTLIIPTEDLRTTRDRKYGSQKNAMCFFVATRPVIFAKVPFYSKRCLSLPMPLPAFCWGFCFFT